MQLEKMKKADLVKLARELRQELKLAKKKSGEAKPEDLPLVGLSQVIHNGVDKIVFLRYDLETEQAAVEKVVEEMNKPLANLSFDNAVLKYLDEQRLDDGEK